MPAQSVDTSSTTTERWSALSAVAFAALFVAGMFLVVPYDTDQDDAALAAALDDNKAVMVVGIYAGALAALAFQMVATAFLRRLAGTFTERGLTAARSAALVGTIGLALGPAIAGSPGFAELFGGREHPVDPAVIRFIPNVGLVTLMSLGALGIALFLGLLTRAGRQSGLLPTWFLVVSYVTILAMILAALFMPLIMLPIWALSSAVVLAKPSSA